MGHPESQYQPIEFPLRQRLDQLHDGSTEPRALMAFWRQQYPELYDVDAGTREGYTIAQHTEMVLEQFAIHFTDQPLPGQVDKDFFRVIIALHDVGKGDALAAGDKHLQHQYTPELADGILSELGYNEEERDIATALLSADYIGGYLKQAQKGSETASESAATQIVEAAAATPLTDEDFLALATVLYKVDVSSYTTAAGGSFKYSQNAPGMDFLFADSTNGLNFAQNTAQAMARLEAAVTAHGQAGFMQTIAGYGIEAGRLRSKDGAEEIRISDRSLDEVNYFFRGLLTRIVERQIEISPEPISVLDLGGGPQSRAIAGLVRQHESRLKGVNVDLLAESLPVPSNTNTHAVKASVLPLPFASEVFNVVYSRQLVNCFDSENDYAKERTLLREIYRVLKAGGIGVIHEDRFSQQVEDADTLGQYIEEPLEAFAKQGGIFLNNRRDWFQWLLRPGSFPRRSFVIMQKPPVDNGSTELIESMPAQLRGWHRQ
jgi:ubiquinone/menaquinone biosynthesis C-methylase UbiE